MSGSGISWAICKSAHRSRQITTPVPHHSVFYRPDALPAAQPTASKHWRPKDHRTSYTTASARQCKCGRFSLPQYSKQEWPLFTAALEQTLNVTTARNVGRSSSRVRWRASGLPYPASGRRSWLPPSPPSVAFPVHVLTHAPRRRRPGRCPPLNVPIRQAPTTKTNFCT